MSMIAKGGDQNGASSRSEQLWTRIVPIHANRHGQDCNAEPKPPHLHTIVDETFSIDEVDVGAVQMEPEGTDVREGDIGRVGVAIL